MSGGNFVQFSERAYRYIRQFSIKNVHDALIELITNADDAYSRMEKPKRHFALKYHSGKNQLWLVDQATGLTGEDMEACFLQVGNYTSSGQSRGFFSRGAKDISVLGDVTFETICQNRYSSCRLDQSAYGQTLQKNVPVTPKIRQTLGIEQNGLSVRLDLLPQHRLDNLDQFCLDLSRMASLRDIMAHPENTVHMTDLESQRVIPIKYCYPEGDLLLDLTFEVPSYSGVEARLVVYKAHMGLDQPKTEKQMEFGFLIKGGRSIHEVSTLQSRFRWHPYMNMIYGRLECEYLNYLLYQIDQEGPSEKNPMIVVDPSRSTGLNREHPFVQNLLEIPIKRLDLILQELDSVMSGDSVSISDFNDLLEQLKEAGLDFSDCVEYKWSGYRQRLNREIQTERNKYVSLERNFLTRLKDPKYHPPTLKTPKEEIHHYYVVDNSGQVTSFQSEIDINQSEIDPNQMKQFMSQLTNLIDGQNPFVYQLLPDNQVSQVYLFDQSAKGTTEHEQILSRDQSNLIKISYTKDLNLRYKYQIENKDNQIKIKININDPMIQKYLVVDQASSRKDLHQKTKSKAGHIFMAQLFTEIFARVLLQSKVKGGVLVLDEGDYQKTLKAYEECVNTVQEPVNQIFIQYHNSDLEKELNNLPLEDETKEQIRASFQI